jgi:3-deoxy-D-manno-octulosonic-acid transferase
MGAVYNIFITVYLGLIRLAAYVNPKARLWVDGRKDLWALLEKELIPGKPRLWFHCASLGEFEQGRPLIEACREKYPGYEIMLTFFSPSGYTVRKNYEGADHVFYLPMDTVSNARRFVMLTQPKAAFFIKYEYWFNLLDALDHSNVPVFMVSAIFRPGQHFFRFYGNWARKRLNRITHFFVQNEESQRLLNGIGIKHATITGDTRFDRVYSIAARAKESPLLTEFLGDERLFLAGSSWPEDEKITKELINKKLPGIKFAFAPHEVDEHRIKALAEKLGKNCLRFTKIRKGQQLSERQILVIDTIGLLSSLYRHATYAFIGGGYGKGIHNILEAATFGMPIFFGPNYEKFQEARDLVERGGAFSITDSQELYEKITQLEADHAYYFTVAGICKAYVNEKRGATAAILVKINSYL